MRDKDYRGQHTSTIGGQITKCWVHGYLCEKNYINDMLVNPETVGEFVTCNKEGQRLYTDDLFRYRLGHIVQLIWDEKESRYIGQAVGYLNTHFSMGLVKEMKLIGNIHDNPDILSPNYGGKKTNLIIFDEIKTNEEEK